MNPFNSRSEQREYEQAYYGGYCNKVRILGLNPIPFHLFQDILNDFTKTKKERMRFLIKATESQ
ncbi:hypothetical protein WV34_06445 [Bacillus amyloliquefaciens]|nr:hypothetical protein WV34_06445 [Bacillus amyloliquefaciens]OCB96928.1 hypothetical protein SRCM101294_01115 [Bacillus amyloliquefaciens]